MSTVITVENLSKKYILSHQKKERYQTLRDNWAHVSRSLWQRIAHPLSPNREKVQLEEFWALKDINFEIKQGERVGIIGHNGAGKSTLLKILSRITEPTTGRIKLKGRVASLLEVGTGFHPELTGRENIYLNGAILGMTREEIKRKFDEIVAFAEVEKFLDTPVKRYSSGMYVRLAFAVAAHLEPEILVVDEVLAVGDAQFQKKCLGKMDSVAKEGRTILFVSHNMFAIQNFCTRALLVRNSFLIQDDKVKTVVDQYLTDSFTIVNKFIPKDQERISNKEFGIFIENFYIKPSIPITGKPLDFIFEIKNVGKDTNIDIAISISSNEGIPLLRLFSDHTGKKILIPGGKSKIIVKIDRVPLLSGMYSTNLWLGKGDIIIDWARSCFILSIQQGELGSANHLESSGYPIIIPSEWVLKN